MLKIIFFIKLFDMLDIYAYNQIFITYFMKWSFSGKTYEMFYYIFKLILLCTNIIVFCITGNYIKVSYVKTSVIQNYTNYIILKSNSNYSFNGDFLFYNTVFKHNEDLYFISSFFINIIFPVVNLITTDNFWFLDGSALIDERMTVGPTAYLDISSTMEVKETLTRVFTEVVRDRDYFIL